MSRQAELKENILAHHIENFLMWVIERRVQVLTLLGVVLAAVLIGSVFALRQKEAREQARTKLAYSQALLSQARFAEAATTLDEIRKGPMDTDTARLTAYLRGVASVGQSKADEAVTFLTEAVDLSRNHPIRPLAIADLGSAQEQKKDFEAAIASYALSVSEYPDHFMSPRVMLALGRVQILAGKNDEVADLVERLIDLHPTSEWAENARRLIDKTGKR